MLCSFRSLFFVISAVFCSVTQAAESAITVLTAHPATYSLTSALVQQTNIKVIAVQPARLPATRLTAYLEGRGKSTLEKAAAEADAVITMGAMWQQDPLYPYARRTRLGIINIDMTRPLDDTLPGVSQLNPTLDRSWYEAFSLQPMLQDGENMSPWLSPTALARMADILANDLTRLSVNQGKQIDANLATIKHRLLEIKLRSDQTLALADSVTTLSLSPHFAYFSADVGLDNLATVFASPREWTTERLSTLTRTLQQEDIAVVLLDSEPSASLQAAILAASARYLVLSDIPGDSTDPVATIEENVRRLLSAFAP